MQYLRLLPRALNTSLRRYSHPQTIILSPLPSATSKPPSNPLLPAIAAAVLSLTAHAALSESNPTPHTHDWHSLISTLQSHTHPPNFSASRRALDHSDTAFSYTLHFSAPQADLWPILIHLSSTLVPHAALAVDEIPTRTLITLTDSNFQLSLSVPRIPPFETSVEINIDTAHAPVFSQNQVDAILHTYHLCQAVDRLTLLDGKQHVECSPSTKIKSSPRKKDCSRTEEARQKLEQLGVEVFDAQSSNLTWASLAGYEEVKQQIEDTLTLPLRHPQVYESIVRGTRQRYQPNLPKAVLYEGPPGCGKTLSAKILAARIGIPFVHVPLETILSKFYGETTKKLADILQTANELGVCLVFIDECDTIGLSRSSTTDVHEVTRRTLSVLLRHLDGLDGQQNTILLAATNHKQDIDPALMSRFDVVVSFPLPDLQTRAAILKLYAKHLSKDELDTLATLSGGFSGRELLDVCQQAERMKGGDIVRGGGEGLPQVKHYVAAISRKAPHVVGEESVDIQRDSVQPAVEMERTVHQRTKDPAPSVAT